MKLLVILLLLGFLVSTTVLAEDTKKDEGKWCYVDTDGDGKYDFIYVGSCKEYIKKSESKNI